MKKSIFRSSSLKWGVSIDDALDYLAIDRHVQKTTALVGRHGWGKSTVLEYLSDNFDGAFVEGDVLISLAYLLMLGVPGHSRVQGAEVWPWLKATGGHADPDRWHRLTTIIAEKQLLKNVNVVSTLTGEAEDVWIVLPPYEQYCRQLAARTKVMLAQPEWRKFSKSSWPILTHEQYCEAISTYVMKHTSKLKGILANIDGKESDIWKAWFLNNEQKGGNS